MWWRGDILPPDVFVGRMVCFAGKIRTYDGGFNFSVFDAVYIPGGKNEIAPVFKELDKLYADPTDWISDLHA